MGVFRSLPEPGSLDIHADVVLVWKPLRQGNGVFSLAAAQFQHYRVAVVEHLFVPVAFQRMLLAYHLVHPWLDEAFECLVFLEFAYFVLTHKFIVLPAVSY